MVISNELVKQIRNIKSDISKMDSIKELIEYIPITKIRLIAVILCLLWVLSPFYIMLKSMFLDSHGAVDYYINRFDLGLTWYILLQQIGFLGCFIMFLVIIKKFINRTAHKNFWKMLLNNHGSALLLACLLFWAIISTVLSDNSRLSLHGTVYRRDGLISYIAYAGLFFCGYLLEKQYFNKVTKWFVWTSSFLALLMLIDIEYINRLFTFHPNSTVFYNINHFGYYLCIAILSAATLYLIRNPTLNHHNLFLVCFTILVAALIKNRSFGPYLAVVSGLIFIFLATVLYTKNHFKDVIIILVTFIFISVIMNLFVGVIGTEISKLLGGITDIVQDTETVGEAGSGRWKIWVHGIRFIAEKPLFGYGPENLGGRYMLEGIQQDRPHNEFIQIAATLGIPALCFYVMALFKLFYVVFINRIFLTITVICLNAITITYLVSSLFGNTMFYTSPFYFMLLGITVGTINRWENGLHH